MTGVQTCALPISDYTGTEIAWCPGIDARNWQNDAWSPKTNLHYVSTNNTCATSVNFAGEYKPGEGYTLRRAAGGAAEPNKSLDGKTTTNNGALTAIDPVSRKIVWEKVWAQNNQTPVSAAGDLLFQGGNDKGVLRAFNAKTGEIAWEFRTGSRFNQSPIVYLGPDKKEYLAVIA